MKAEKVSPPGPRCPGPAPRGRFGDSLRRARGADGFLAQFKPGDPETERSSQASAAPGSAELPQRGGQELRHGETAAPRALLFSTTDIFCLIRGGARSGARFTGGSRPGRKAEQRRVRLNLSIFNREFTETRRKKRLLFCFLKLSR
ncbi:hypothetical protein MHYP_G00033960 [Metynnis hypsauchen]